MFVTIDQNLQYQQNLVLADIAVVVLESRTNRYEDLLPIVPRLLSALAADPKAGEIVHVGL